ncbi:MULTISPECIES: ABC transporter ATP-binding protein [unclassified Neptuniibacter]|uniref:ABC transporter ATP-binding protein n=1 Tax=unclassified Neptuniibacter TaxID=2630693 RepID=UPI000C5AD624|nr:MULTISPECIES: ABC transporter ATP-binding protein [unclassified Neptuniibacter]MAY43622.1 multidrug ABC transporter ATP-binding protein [Oceanospirillaceae bacterium]|tara:strand:- start:10452 stop:12281 length:1830 start_codon:yes stop_codon:yes gene_type:complete
MFSFFERLIPAFPPAEPGQPPKGIYAFCRHYTKGAEGPLILMSLLTATIAILEVTLFGFMGQLVDWLSTQDRESFLNQQADTLLLMSLVPLVALPLAGLLHSLITHQTLLGNYPMSIRWLAHRYLLKQSVSFYANDFAGRISTKVMQTALSVRESVMKLLDVMMFVIVYFFSMLVLVGQSDWLLTLPMLIWLVCYIAIQSYFVPKLKKISTEQADARSMMTGRIVDSYANIVTVKLFSHTNREAEYAKEGMDEFMRTVHIQMRLATGLNLSVQCINHLLSFSVAALSIWLWMEDSVSVGAIAISVALALRLNGMAHWIMWEISALFENIGTVADGMATLSQPLQIQDKSDAKEIKVSKGEIHFDQVGFHYGEDKKVIEQLNLKIKPGEKIGLVGRSGAGKSTIVNLLMRFFEVESGSIKIDGQNLSQVTQDSLRANIGMVTQDTALLHRSVRENLLYGRPDANEDEMITAAKQAEAHDFILGLTDPQGRCGYDAHVGERGVKLSGGQRQRIAIARVLLKDAPILILDEATSALDSEVEAAIQASLYKLMQGKTVIAIAHRLSTIAALDRLVVLDQGDIAEEGNHQALIQSKGIYAQLWAHQTGGFLGEK